MIHTSTFDICFFLGGVHVAFLSAAARCMLLMMQKYYVTSILHSYPRYLDWENILDKRSGLTNLIFGLTNRKIVVFRVLVRSSEEEFVW